MNNKIQTLTVLFLAGALFLVSCSGKVNRPTTEIEEVPLKHTALWQDTSVLGYIPVAIWEDTLFLRANTTPVYEMCQLSGDTITKTAAFIRIGDGPYDLSDPYVFFISKENRKLYVGDWRSRKLIGIPFPLSSHVPATDSWERISCPHGERSFLLAYGDEVSYALSDSTFLILGGEIPKTWGGTYEGPENFLSLAHIGEELMPVGGLAYPDSGKVNIPVMLKRLVYNDTSLLKQPGNNRFALVGRNMGNYLILFSLSGRQAEDIRIIRDEYPRYEMDDTGFDIRYDHQQKNGYAAQATSRYIYLLESPFSTVAEQLQAKDYKGYPADSRDKLLVYDWEGNLVASYKLDIPVTAFLVADDDSAIYASVANLEKGQDEIIKFQLQED